jgi:type I restriction enzyme S subunit
MTLPCRSGAFGGIMGRDTFASEATDGLAVTEDMVRCELTSKEYTPEYIFAVLSSLQIGYPMITAFRYGKDVPHIDPDQLTAIPIPVLTTAAREAVGEHTSKAYQELDKANQLEVEAVTDLLHALGWPQNEDWL